MSKEKDDLKFDDMKLEIDEATIKFNNLNLTLITGIDSFNIIATNLIWGQLLNVTENYITITTNHTGDINGKLG